MRKILWLSNYVFSEGAMRASGGWIASMGRAVVSSGQYELYNISIGGVEKIVRRDAGGVRQWILPARLFMWKHLGAFPPQKVVDWIARTVNEEIRPDLVHVWGTERFWGLLTARKIIHAPALLEVQGIKHAIGPYVLGGLSVGEQLRCLGIKELLMPSLSIFATSRSYINGARDEVEMLRGHKYVDYQSEWTRSWIAPYVKGNLAFKTRRMIRQEFLVSTPWKYQEGNFRVFSSCGLTGANKGAHILLRAFAIVLRQYPDARLRLTGRIRKGVHLDGYTRFLLREISRLGLGGHVDFVGQLSASEMVDEMLHDAVGVVPSFVESYSASLAEGMAVGLPMVASYAGAMPEVGGDGVLYAPIGDVGMLAGRISELFEMKEQVEAFTMLAREKSMRDHNPTEVLARQLQIYEEIFGDIEKGPISC